MKSSHEAFLDKNKDKACCINQFLQMNPLLIIILSQGAVMGLLSSFLPNLLHCPK